MGGHSSPISLLLKPLILNENQRNWRPDPNPAPWSRPSHLRNRARGGAGRRPIYDQGELWRPLGSGYARRPINDLFIFGAYSLLHAHLETGELGRIVVIPLHMGTMR